MLLLCRSGPCLQNTGPNRAVGPAVGLINALGNLGGYIGPVAVGALTKRLGDFRCGFDA
jgi:hypothetical protein